MREIKFRAWGKKSKKMVECDFWDVEGLMKPEDEYWSRPMQYTGLKDKNSVEIYEGDILEDEKGKGLIKWVPEHCAFLAFVPDPAGYHYLESDGQLKNSKVIGNIYEHSGLLGDYNVR